MSRLENTSKNAAWSLIHIVVSSAFGFITRWVFMQTLGEQFLGLNGLFASVLSVLSFAELGLGAAIAFCFYKPVAEDNIPQIVALIQLCKKVFRVIMLVIAGLGLAIMPFLQYLIKDYQGIAYFYLYYLIALVNTIASYLLVYKTCYQAACQEGYRTQKLTTLFWVLTALGQIVCMYLTHNYLVYLIFSCVMNLAEKLVTSLCLDKWYPIIHQKITEPVAPEALRSIKKNVKSLLIINLGNTVVTQSDTLITSRFVGLITVGLISNYTMITNIVVNLIAALPNSVTNSMGNLVASQDEKKQLEVFGMYQTVCGWLAAFSFCGLAVFLSPFISLVFGADKTVDEVAIFLLCLSVLLKFQQSNLDVLRTAHGAYEAARSVAYYQAAANLLFSIPAAMLWGVRGVYLGTVLSMLVPYFAKPAMVFKHIYHRGAGKYYKTLLWQTATALLIFAVLMAARLFLYRVFSPVAAFFLLVPVAVLLFPLLLVGLSCKDPYFGRTAELVKSYAGKKAKALGAFVHKQK